MAKRRVTIGSIRGLKQYQGWTEEELAKEVARIRGDTKYRVDEVLESLYADYDLSEMNANDELSLRNLAQMFVRLEDIEKQIDQAMAALDDQRVERLNRVAAVLRKDASQIQQDLNITRKARKSEREQGLAEYIEAVKKRATTLLSERLSYVYCPKCKMLLANIWFLYPDEDENVLRLRCNRIVDGDSGEVCDCEFTVTSKELKEQGNRNIEGVLRT